MNYTMNHTNMNITGNEFFRRVPSKQMDGYSGYDYPGLVDLLSK